MKQIDRVVLGPSAPLLWQMMRKRRYTPMTPPRALYFILPQLGLSAEERQQVILEEMNEGYEVWEPMETTIDGMAASVPVCRKWGAILLGGRVMALDQYPINELTSIETTPEVEGEPAGTPT
ncbi:MAG: hypothetical protein GY716_13925 [bacterium]|nr:hypothetical protein [bacterium]